MIGNKDYSKTRCIHFPDEVEIGLYKIFLDLNKLFGATYMSYTFDRHDHVRFSFRSDENWASIYNIEEIKGKPIIQQCPLDIISRSRKNQYILWDYFLNVCQPKIYREIMGLRKDVGLQHGITLSEYFLNHHDAIAIATEEKKNDIATRILFSKNTFLSHYLFLCRKLAVKYFAIFEGAQK